MSLEETKENITKKVNKSKDEAKIKREEQILKVNEKKNDAKMKLEEKKLEIKKNHNERKIEAHINLAEVRIDEALDNAEFEIAVLASEVDDVIIKEEEPVELILFKAENILEEIFLRTQLKVQVAKNKLITQLSSDLEDTIELAAMENNISDVKDKMETVIGALEGKIASEKEELKEKYGEE